MDPVKGTPPGKPLRIYQTDVGNLPMREIILLKAKELFRAKGFAAVSINDIVDAVGVTKPTLYHYFKDKENLFLQVLVAMLESGHQNFSQGIADIPGFEERLYTLALGYFQYSPTSIATVMRDAREYLSPENQTRFYEAMETSIMKPISEIFDAAIATGELPARDTHLLAGLFASFLDTTLTVFRLQNASEDEIIATSRDMVSVFLYGIKTPPAKA